MTPSQDADQLRLLSIFHYVVSGILAVFSMFPILHLAMGIAMLAGAFDDASNGSSRPPAFLGYIMILVPAVIILCGLAMTLCVAIAGRRLGHHRNYMYCLVIAGIECMFIPFGTILGVFTLIVLSRPTVKDLFGVAQITEP